jgi:hypothetical protein
MRVFAGVGCMRRRREHRYIIHAILVVGFVNLVGQYR